MIAHGKSAPILAEITIRKSQAGINPKYDGFSEKNRRLAVKLANEIKNIVGHL